VKRGETTVPGIVPVSVTASLLHPGVIRLRMETIDGDQLTADLAAEAAAELAKAILDA
jgi:hypothetical protein